MYLGIAFQFRICKVRFYFLNVYYLIKSYYLAQTMGEVKYRNAYDESGRLVSIAEVNDENRYQHKYFCIGCGAELKPRLGFVNAHHFYHIDSTHLCSGETYLHKLAKKKLVERFHSSKEFVVAYYRKLTCKEEKECEFYSIWSCQKEVLEEFDVKRYYDMCTEEQSLDKGKFQADICISDSSGKNSPILIEICVSHKSEKEKLESGHKIIEIKITSEEDIEALCLGKIVASNKYSENPNQVMFYGFKKESLLKETLHAKFLSRFILYDSGKAYVSSFDREFMCDSRNRKHSSHSLIEFNIDEGNAHGNLLAIGLIKALDCGFNVKNCQLCKYLKEAWEGPMFCTMSKNYGTPQHPNYSEALICKYYRINKERIEQERENMSRMLITRVE